MSSTTADLNKVLEIIPRDVSEDSVALMFAVLYENELRYDHTRGSWYRWDGSRWRIEETQLAFDYARNLIRAYNKTHSDKSLPKVRTASAVEQFARADRRLAVTGSLWNNDPWLLCTPGGTVELHTGTMRENRQDDHITKCSTVTPEDKPTPIWSAFLNQATQNDRELQRFLQQIAGYSLTGDTREHGLFFVYGSGGNGKGVFVNTVSNAMGDYALAAAMDTFTSSKYDRHPTELADLAGARLVTASETEEGRAWAESRIKTLTGGDPIKARYMRQDFFQYQPQFKLMFLGNHKPVLHNVDDAARRRFHIIPLNHKPSAPDKELPEKLKAEYGGILHWAIQGCLDWRTNGLCVPKVVKLETEAYFADQDTFGQWLAECTTRKYETTGEPAARLFTSWKSWAQLQGEDPGTAKRFAERLSVAGFRKVKDVPGHRGQRGFVGIAINVEAGECNSFKD
jgi:putative DNA primase/helicase